MPSTSPPASSSPSPPPSTEPQPQPQPPHRPILLALLIACPLLMLLPPRKLDLYTFSLAGTWVLSAEEVTIGSAALVRPPPPPPPRVRHALPDHDNDGGVGTRGDGVQKGREERGGGGERGGEKEGIAGLIHKLWMGDETAGWQRRRLERERAQLEGGSGYGDLILGQVREVLGGFGGRRDDGEDEEGGGDGEGEGEREEKKEKKGKEKEKKGG